MDTTLIDRLRAARTLNGLSAREVARLAGVEPSTVTRIEQGAFPRASYEVISRLLRANDLGADLQPLSQPTAIQAARLLLGDTVPAPYDLPEWLDRWCRLGLVEKDGQVTNSRDLVFRAGRSAWLASRPGAVDLPRTLTWDQVADRLNAADVDWAATGDAAANRLSEYADETWPVLYVEDLRAAVEALDLSPRLPCETGPRITLIPFDGTSELGRWVEDNMRYAAPWQVVMDSYAGTQRMPLQADWILDGWETAE